MACHNIRSSHISCLHLEIIFMARKRASAQSRFKKHSQYPKCQQQESGSHHPLLPALQGRFDVLSDDPQAASRTLDQKTLSHLIEFHDKINRNIRIAFIGDKIQTAIWHEETIRAPRIWRTILSKKYIQGFLQEYSTALKVVSSALSR